PRRPPTPTSTPALQRRSSDLPFDPDDFSACAAAGAGENTTIAVVATNAPLDRSGCRRLAIMAQDGLAQAIRPAHTPFDGDTVFADRKSTRLNSSHQIISYAVF